MLDTVQHERQLFPAVTSPVAVLPVEVPRRVLATRYVVPCRSDPELWFAEAPADVERAKSLCRECPIQRACLAGALERREPWGVWGGELFEQGRVVPRKRPRGRPRKDEGEIAA